MSRLKLRKSEVPIFLPSLVRLGRRIRTPLVVVITLMHYRWIRPIRFLSAPILLTATPIRRYRLFRRLLGELRVFTIVRLVPEVSWGGTTVQPGPMEEA